MSRVSDFPVLDSIMGRRSLRALSDQALDDATLMSLFEAARWAPSSYNNQPWRLVYVRPDDPAWPAWCATMVEFNRTWASRAQVLVAVASSCLFSKTGKPSRTHAFDTGAAWQNFGLQAYELGLIAHAMEGFDYDALARLIQLPADHELHCLVAVGYPGDPADLPERMAQQDRVPTDRNPMSQFVYKGHWNTHG